MEAVRPRPNRDDGLQVRIKCTDEHSLRSDHPPSSFTGARPIVFRNLIPTCRSPHMRGSLLHTVKTSGRVPLRGAVALRRPRPRSTDEKEGKGMEHHASPLPGRTAAGAERRGAFGKEREGKGRNRDRHTARPGRSGHRSHPFRLTHQAENRERRTPHPRFPNKIKTLIAFVPRGIGLHGPEQAPLGPNWPSSGPGLAPTGPRRGQRDARRSCPVRHPAS